MVERIVVTSAPTGSEAPVGNAEENPAASTDTTTVSTETPQSPETPSERPAWLPEKFATVEDLMKSYSELESKLGDKPKDKPEEGAEGESEEKTEEGTEKEDKAAENTPAEPVDIDALSSEWAEKGSLSDESYESLEKRGFSKETVDQIAAALNAQAEFATQRLTEAAGGKESMDQLFTWASTSLKGEEVDGLNKVFAGNDVNAAVMAMEQLRSAYEKANGKQGSLLKGTSTSPVSSEVYNSWAQVTEDMNNPKYKADPAFRSKVEQKLVRSKLNA